MEKVWKIKNNGHDKDIDRLSSELNVDPVLSTLLVQRGIRTLDQAQAFFNPDIKNLYDPFLMADMDKAIERIERAVSNNENILIYGDYDVDGTTSVAMVYSFFNKFHKNLDYYIPDRYNEGYGISFKGIEYAALNRIKLIIALDCGIKAIEKIEFAKDRGIDFIVCDHHTPGDTLPDAVAVLDPERKDCKYPFNYLSGCGVGFKMMHAYSIRNNIPFEEIMQYLDLVAVSIASDIVPLIDENRILTYYGLQKLNNDPCIGLKAIIACAGMEGKPIAVDDIVFKISPRINAAGRIKSGKQAVELLINEKAEEAVLLCERINTFNQARRNIDKTITEEALKEIESSGNENKYSTILYNRNWHKGVVGIVASRLIETLYRPTIILTESNGFAAGSARSVIGFDLYKAISKCSDLLESFGGHRYAAGLTLKIENVPKLKERFEKVVRDTITPEQQVPQIEIDAELNLKSITSQFYSILKKFEPFGPDNLNPIFFAESVVDNGYGKVVGSGEEHLKLSLVQEAEPFNVFPAIAFNQAYHYERISRGRDFDIAYTLAENHFRGRTTIQLNIKDIKV